MAKRNDPLSPEIVSLLGTMPDRRLAKKAGCSENQVFLTRTHLGIESFQEKQLHKERSKVPLHLLGTISDRRLAEQCRTTYEIVHKLRVRLGIKARWVLGEAPDWDNLPLGELHDHELAASLKCSASHVATQRINRGIPAFRQPKTVPPQDLGKIPDPVLAKRYGVSKHCIQKRRIKLGIPAYKKFEWSANIALFGKKTNPEISKQLDLPVGVVARARRKQRAEHPWYCVCGKPSRKRSRFCTKACGEKVNRMKVSLGIRGKSSDLDHVYYALYQVHARVNSRSSTKKRGKP